MALAWNGWAENTVADTNRYLDWDKISGGLQPSFRDVARDAIDTNSQKIVFPSIDPSAFRGGGVEFFLADGGALKDDSEFLQSLLFAAMQRIYSDYETAIPPVPGNSLTGAIELLIDAEGNETTGTNPIGYVHHIENHGPLPEALLVAAEDVPEALRVPKDTVIAGAIDVGIPLGHRRTRLPDGRTRILAAWQQTASRGPLDITPATHLDDKSKQFYIPFGREYLAHEINESLAEHSQGDLQNGLLDEDSFNRAMGAEDYEMLFGQRDLGARASHGAHVLDCLAGLAPEHQHAEALRIIAVNLPESAIVGHSAQFLELFAVHGMLRIVMLADALWDKLYADGAAEADAQGFPIVINLSFGKQAGPRDGLDLIADVLAVMNERRTTQNRRPVFLSMPAGNENLEQGNIPEFELATEAEKEIKLRVLPEDQSANFVEIWTEAGSNIEEVALAIQIRPPEGPASPLSVGSPEHVLDLMDITGDGIVARLYSDSVDAVSTIRGMINGDEDTVSVVRKRYLLAIKQTLLFEDTPLAPAGVWRIKLRNDSSAAIKVSMSVQTDQTETPSSVVNQRSYFEDEDYERFDETGRVIDSFDYPDAGSAPVAHTSTALVNREGTINAVGATSHTALVAGYRRTDGRMMPYSSTGNIRNNHSRLPVAAMPSRDGYAHYGTLASGARDGTVAALEGTSFSSARFARRFIDDFLGLRPTEVEALWKNYGTLAAYDDRAYARSVAPLKAGAGRLHPIASGRKIMRF